MSGTLLVRYGSIPEVARFRCELEATPQRGAQVVVRSHRGDEIGTVLDHVRFSPPEADADADGDSDSNDAGNIPVVLRPAGADDMRRHVELKQECEREFGRWLERIGEWNLELELIDAEWTLDRSKLILYVLNDRGPECTRLALLTAAAGLGPIEVQPVGPDGPTPLTPSGGCGSGGCGSGGCRS